MEFNLDQAIQALHTVCRQYKGTADDHEYLKSILNEIYKKLKVEPKEEKKDHLRPVPNAEG
jgi:predicted metal-dependent hydrolase